MNDPTYGLIGRGRLARHLTHYLEIEGQTVVGWHRGLLSPPEEIINGTDVTLLAVSDDAIVPFLEDHPRLRRRPVAHFSGSLVIDDVPGLHPLMTFGPVLYDLDTYRSIPFVTERGGGSFSEVFPGLQNPAFGVDPDLKPLYHALCVMAGNFTTLLWSKAMEDFDERLGLPREILETYLRQTATNTLNGGGASLTGPIARGDLDTIERDLAGLGGDPFSGVYQAFVRAVAETGVRS